MAHDDEDDYGSDTHDAASKAGNSVASSVGDNGDVDLYGMKFSVGKAWAPVARTFAEYLGNQITDKLGQGAFNTIWNNADKIGLPKHKAFFVARAFEYIFRLGPQLLDVGLDVKRTVTDRYGEIDSVSKMLNPYLAANHNMSVGKQPFMLDDNPMIANVRNHMMEKGKNGLWGAFAKFVGKAPNVMLAVWRSKLFEIENAQRLTDALAQIDPAHRAPLEAQLASLNAMSATPETKANKGTQIQEIMDKFESYKEERKKKGQTANEVDFLINNVGVGNAVGLITDVGGWADTAKMIAKPKNVTELALNSSLFDKLAPLIGANVPKMIVNKFVKPVKGKTEDFVLFKLTSLAQQIQAGEIPRHHELKDIIENAFKQHMQESGHKHPLKGEKLDMISDKLAKALGSGELNPFALIDLVGKNKLIHFKEGAYHFASREETDRDILAETKKYLPRVNLKEFYKEAPFKKEDIKCVFDKLDDDLKALFVACVPVNVLEDVGVKPQEINHVMRGMEEKFRGMASDVLKRVSEMSNEELVALGVKEKTADQLRSLAEEFADSAQYGDSETVKFLEENKHKIQIVLRDITMAEKGRRAIAELTGSAEKDVSEEAKNRRSTEDLQNLSGALDEEDRASRHSKKHTHGRHSAEDNIRKIKERGERKHHGHRVHNEEEADLPMDRR